MQKSEMEPQPDPVHQALVHRMLDQYDPFQRLGFGTGQSKDCQRYISPKLQIPPPPPPPTLSQIENIEPLEFLSMLERDLEYHKGRISYFVQELRAGRTVEPLEVDNDCHLFHILPQIVLIDGHHRLCAAALLDWPTLPISYCGRIDLWIPSPEDQRATNWSEYLPLP